MCDLTRIAIVEQEKCRSTDCGLECIKYCPPMRTGTEVILIDPETKKARIIEELCEGESICVKKCPFKAIQIINLPEDFDADVTYRYSENGFKLHRIPLPTQNIVLGLVGQNGAGKSTSLKILAGELALNFGDWEKDPDWKHVSQYYRGSELQKYFDRLGKQDLKIVIKPQTVSHLPRYFDGTIEQLLLRASNQNEDEALRVRDILGLEPLWTRDIKKLSGGELQKLAIGATMVQDADVYLFDEPSSYLDVRERMNVAQLIREMRSENRFVIVVEHDLAILDYLSDQVCLYYGQPGAYGVVTTPYTVRKGINMFLEGYLPNENLRFRQEPISFQRGRLRGEEDVVSHGAEAFSYGDMSHSLGDFSLEIQSGEIQQSEIIGIVGSNGTGKTTFVKILAGVIEPDNMSEPLKLRQLEITEGIDKDDGSPLHENNGQEQKSEIENIADFQKEKETGSAETEWNSEEEEKENGNETQKTALNLRVSYKPQYLKSDSTETVLEVIQKVNSSLLSSALLRTEIFIPLQLEHLLERRLDQLSGGELQKLSIALCLSREADIYLLDEPTAYISAEDRVVVSRVIKRVMAHRRSPAFVIEHDLMMITYVSSRIIVFSGEAGLKGQCTAPMSVEKAMNRFLKEMGITFREDTKTGRPRVNKQNSQIDRKQKQQGIYYHIGA